jgi:phosphoglycolate phosphatase-like HAD superfamily hydrolase
MPKTLIRRDWACWVFDCDGVLLDSNRVKTDACFQSALPYGTVAADAFVAHHVAHGGVSRFSKVRYFFEAILQREPHGDEEARMLERIAKATRHGLKCCAIAPDLDDLMAAIPRGTRRIVVSGGAQSELRRVLAEREIDRHFDRIFGSPDSKDDILVRELSCGGLPTPALFVGDSRYDYEVATRARLDFAFVSGWTEFTDWRGYFAGKEVFVAEQLADLLTLCGDRV